MICPNCKNSVPNGTKYCNYCGGSLNTDDRPISDYYGKSKEPSGCLIFLIAFTVAIIWFVAYVNGASKLVNLLFAIVEIILFRYIFNNINSNRKPAYISSTPNSSSKTTLSTSVASAPVQKISCKKCGGTNINISINTFESSSKGQEQFKEKSAARKATTKIARGTANLMTVGMYGVFSKKPTDYVNVTKSKTKMRQQKIAICQECGNSWIIY